MIRKIKIGYLDYIVSKVKEIVVKTQREGETENISAYAAIDFEGLRIDIQCGLAYQVEILSLMHEVIHGLDESYKIGLDETQTDALAHAFLQMVRDNPTFLKMIIKGGGIKCR